MLSQIIFNSVIFLLKTKKYWGVYLPQYFCGYFEPLMGIGPATSSLPRKCSTTELQRLIFSSSLIKPNFLSRWCESNPRLSRLLRDALPLSYNGLYQIVSAVYLIMCRFRDTLYIVCELRVENTFLTTFNTNFIEFYELHKFFYSKYWTHLDKS